jgi:divalent metal cation (Fe/Co/Zn/Cd) transporter
METATLSNDTLKRLYNNAYWLAIFTIIYNLVEGIIATLMGYQDETLALFGFGVDSFIEMISGIGIAVMVTRIRKNPDSHTGQFEKAALKVTGYSFYALTAGLIISAFLNIYNAHRPETTFWGVVISSISIVVMLVLIRGKLRTGRALNSRAIIADANCTKVCIYMSLVLLAASLVYELTGVGYVDAVGTLGLAWFCYKEGKECFEDPEHDHKH